MATQEIAPQGKSSHAFTPVLDDPSLVPAAGLVPMLELADRSGLTDLLEDRLTVPSPSRAGKARAVIAGMLTGADDIDGLDVLRAGGTRRVVSGVRAPSTLGTYLRRFTHGHVLQLAAVNRALLTGLARDNPGLLRAKGRCWSTWTTPSASCTATRSRPPPTATLESRA